MPLPTPPGGARLVIVEGDGTWLVRELEASSAEGSSRHLQVSGDGGLRVVRNYPPDWFDWSDRDLLTLVHESTDAGSTLADSRR